MAETVRALPEFARPPVIETVLGVQFSPLEALTIPHYGLYWSRIRADYPRSEVQPTLRPVTEQFEPESLARDPRPEISLVTVPEVRCWFIDRSETRLIQIQRDRFIHNWRKVKGDEVYPRYGSLRPKFEEEWKRFCRFLNDEGIGEPDVDQCEVTYINHIEVGKVVKSFGDVGDVIACWSGTTSGGFLPRPEMVVMDTRFVLPERQGRLHIMLRPGIRQRDAAEVVQLTLTVRGKPKSSSTEAILEWFDLGHEWIVRGFTDFTATRMHELWGKK